MKKKYIILLFSVFLMTACSDWLKVNPRDQMDGEELFKDQDGFKFALVGAYMDMTKQSLYGRDANMLFPEVLADNWNTVDSWSSSPNIALIKNLAKFDYESEDVVTSISNMWSTYYNVIVQLNNILANLDDTKARFSYNNDQLIRGEALGLRAFLHLELLRYFGSVPNKGNVGIPYVTVMTKEIDPLTSKPFDKVISLIEADLIEAESLLKEIDVITKFPISTINEASFVPEGHEPWQVKRQSRFNYYAVLGTRARLYNWIGDKTNAIKYAQMIVEAENPSGSLKFPLIVQSTLVDQVFYAEHLFGLHDLQLSTKVNPIFNTRDTWLTQTMVNIDKAYEKTKHPSDIRYVGKGNIFWELVIYTGTSDPVFNFRKYTGTSDMKAINRIPLLRVAEMYFILIENSPFEEAKEYFIKFAQERSLKYELAGTEMSDQATVLPMLEREYRKEFFGEGQMFFFYKKHDYTSYSWPIYKEIPNGVYVIPKPKEQTQFE